MTKITAIYHAPDGDNPVVTMRGTRFFDGQPVEIEVDPAFAAKLRGNKHFEVSQPEPSEAKASGAVGLRAVHRGRGVYAIYDGDVPLDQLGQMTKADADAFNALSDADKAAFVDKPADPPTQQAPAPAPVAQP